MLDQLDALIRKSVLPEKRLSVVEWCERNIVLEKKLSERSGPYRISRTPYMAELLEDFANPSLRTTTACCATQVGKTQTLLCGLAYRLANNPVNALWVMGNERLARSFAQARLQPMLAGCEVLRDEMINKKTAWKAVEMQFKRCVLNLEGSNSATNLSSRPVGLLVLDEVDKFALASEREADAVMLAMERVGASPSGLVVLASSPTVESGKIWQHFLAGDQRYYYVESPHAPGKKFKLEFSEETLIWDQGAKGADGTWDYVRVRNTAHYRCPFTGQPITDAQKIRMLRDGVWMPEKRGADPRHRSRHLNTLYSPLRTWGDIAVEFLRSKATPGGLQNFHNSWLALPWKNIAVQPEDHDISQLCGDYPRGTCPVPLKVIILGCDVGLDYVRWAVCGFTSEGVQYVIDWGVEKNPASMLRFIDTWKCTVAGEEKRIDIGWMDAPYRRSEVHEACYRSKRRLWPSAGAGGFQTSRGVWTGKVPPYPPWYCLTSYNDEDFKSMLYSDKIKKRQHPGIVFPRNVDGDFVRELTSEHLVEEKGKFVWKRKGPNHLGDCVKITLVGYTWLTMCGADNDAAAQKVGA